MGRFHEYISYELIYKAYIDCRKHKRNTANALEFEMDYHKKLMQLYYDINNLQYEVGKSITFVVDKPVYREVFAADFRDRIVHHLIINRIMPYVEDMLIDDSYSCRVGKGTLYGIKRCKMQAITASENYTKPTYVYKGDLQSYFMTINKDILYNKLKNFIINKCKMDEDELFIYDYLIKIVVFNDCTDNAKKRGNPKFREMLPPHKSLYNAGYHKGLPIGNLTSQIFANIFLHDFDVKIQNLCKVLGYGRYVDDFFIFVRKKEDLKDILKTIREELKNIGVVLHPKKCYIQDIIKGIPFTGCVIKKKRIYVINRVKKSAFNNVKNRLYELKKNPNKKQLYKTVSSINSILGHLSQFNTHRIKNKIFNKQDWNTFKKLGGLIIYHNNIYAPKKLAV